MSRLVVLEACQVANPRWAETLATKTTFQIPFSILDNLTYTSVYSFKLNWTKILKRIYIFLYHVLCHFLSRLKWLPSLLRKPPYGIASSHFSSGKQRIHPPHSAQTKIWTSVSPRPESPLRIIVTAHVLANYYHTKIIKYYIGKDSDRLHILFEILSQDHFKAKRSSTVSQQ